MEDLCRVCGQIIYTPAPQGCPDEWIGMCVMCVVTQEILPYAPPQLVAYISHIMDCEQEHELIIRIIELRDMVRLSRPLVRNNPVLS